MWMREENTCWGAGNLGLDSSFAEMRHMGQAILPE